MKQRGFAPILMIVLLGVVAMVLFAPIPYKMGEVVCLPGKSCPKPGWYWGDSIWDRLQQDTQSEITQTTQVSSTPTIDETANWQTYTNSNYSYSLRYPENYHQDTYTKDYKLDNPLWLQQVFFTTNNPVAGGGPSPQITVTVWKNDASNLKEWYTKHSTTETFDSEDQPELALFFEISNTSDTEISGLEAIRFTSGTMNGLVIRTIVARDQNIYEISLWTQGNLKKDPNAEKNYELVLKSFKLTSRSY